MNDSIEDRLRALQTGDVDALIAMGVGVNSNYPIEQYNLGVQYYNQKDYAEAICCFQHARGDVDAQYRLGVMYCIGLGAPMNLDEATKWWRLAAEQGHADAQYSLGIAYTYGKGVLQDKVEAEKWLRLAAEQGHLLAKKYMQLHLRIIRAVLRFFKRSNS